MAPDPSNDEAGRAEFESSLSEFAQQRGLSIDFNTRVAGKTIDLYKLYQTIIAKGGYDVVSAEKLAWRKMAHDFGFGTANAAAYAFALKTTYYKNLAAYEIKTVHGQDPPPKEILENTTAKGGDLLNRTVENFQPPQKASMMNGGSDSENEEQSTPKDEKMDVDDPGSGAGRSSRGLRQQPPQRVLFQPDITSSRQTRQPSGQAQSPQPATSFPAQNTYQYSASSNPSSSSFTIANYEPRPQMPLTLRPVMTPANNYPLFQAQIKKIRDAKLAALGLGPTPTVMKPGAGFEGPNIYVRILNSLRCSVPAEQDYALHHMVKISHERGDKYRFDSFPGLAEGLLERLLTVSSLFYDVEWKISYTQDDDDDIEVLDGIDGTPDILQRIEKLRRIDPPDELQSGETAHKINKLLEAALTLRNLSILEDNASYLSEMAQFRDFLSIALNLPTIPSITEFKHYVLDTAEQVVRHWRMGESDPLYQSLLNVVSEGSDRGAIISALRTLCRISMNLEDANRLFGVPVSVLQKLFEWIILEDDEFTGACLDLIYQYTAQPKNVLFMFTNCNDIPLSTLTSQLSRLLQYRAAPTTHKTIVAKAVPKAVAVDIPTPPRELMDQFIRFEEPERSKKWLKAIFEEDPREYITQIALWHAYQERFLAHVPQNSLLQAADFIKNVSNVFQSANAQVVQEPTQKFIIKGIRARHAPIDEKNRTYSRCMWRSPGSKPCSEFHLKPRHMLEHIVKSHLGIERKEDGTWNFGPSTEERRDCYWADCHHFERRDLTPTAHQLGQHVKTHLPDVSSRSGYRSKHNRTPANQTVPVRMIDGDVRPDLPKIDPEHGREATYKQLTYQNTPVDEVGNALGLPLTSCLILRNLARNTPKAMLLIPNADHDVLRRQSIEGLFGPIEERLMYVISHNRPLAGYASDIMAWVEKGMRS